MITVNEQMYDEIASLLRNKIGGNNFFNGTIEYDTDEFYSGLTCTLIICRDSEERMLSVLPVWWEYHLYLNDGENQNDFDWNKFSEYLK